nr:MAG TPA: hypothetical protein [Caudoviricetes sp.]
MFSFLNFYKFILLYYKYNVKRKIQKNTICLIFTCFFCIFNIQYC